MAENLFRNLRANFRPGTRTISKHVRTEASKKRLDRTMNYASSLPTKRLASFPKAEHLNSLTLMWQTSAILMGIFRKETGLLLGRCWNNVFWSAKGGCNFVYRRCFSFRWTTVRLYRLVTVPMTKVYRPFGRPSAPFLGASGWYPWLVERNVNDDLTFIYVYC